MLLELFSSKVVLPQMKIWFGFKRGDGPEQRSEHFNQSLQGADVLEQRLSMLKTTFFSGGSSPGSLALFLKSFKNVNLTA